MTPLDAPLVKFLLVDDREENLIALSALLEREGLELLTAKSADEALELLLVHEVALAILDVQMPELDGFALAELMRGAERSRHVPIIFVTADIHERRRVFQGYDAGAVDFLFKPIEPHILRHKANTFFSLFQHRQQLAETLRMNETFVAGVGHDLRNPLNVMMMAAQAIELTSTDEKARVLAGKIHMNGKRMTRMIDDLFDLARGRLASGIPLVRQRFDLTAVVRRVIAGYEALHPGRAIIFGHPSICSGNWDEGRIEQLIDNLLSNALRHGVATAPVSLSIRVEGATTVIAVHNGGAIAPALLPNLFAPFRGGGGTSASSTRTEGLGLGLYIVDRIVFSHGGRIAVRSSEDEGTTFEVRLPSDIPAARVE